MCKLLLLRGGIDSVAVHSKRFSKFYFYRRDQRAHRIFYYWSPVNTLLTALIFRDGFKVSVNAVLDRACHLRAVGIGAEAFGLIGVGHEADLDQN